MTDRIRSVTVILDPVGTVVRRVALGYHGAMGVVFVRTESGDYSAIDDRMRDLGYSTTIVGLDATGTERLLALPVGVYWRNEPTDSERMRDEAWSVVTALGELGARVVAVSGWAAWKGLLAEGWPS